MIILRVVFVALFLAINLQSKVWDVKNSWNVEEEQRWGEWIERMSTAGKSFSSAIQMLKKATALGLNYVKINGVKENFWSDDDLELPFKGVVRSNGKEFLTYDIDCDAFPVLMRAYYSYKRKLPFMYFFSNKPNYTDHTIDSHSYKGTLNQFLSEMNAYRTRIAVFRTSPENVNTFSYPVELSKESVTPGTILFNANGHLMLVASIAKDGTITVFQAHTDGIVTTRTIDAEKEDGMFKNPTHSGGFRKYRTIRLEGEKIKYETNNDLLPYYTKAPLQEFYERTSTTDEILAYIRNTLKESNYIIDPFKELEIAIQEIYADVEGRLMAVERGWEQAKLREIIIPEETVNDNIYATLKYDDWEAVSTPSRDLRLKNSFLSIRTKIREYMDSYSRNKKVFPEVVTSAYGTPYELGKALYNELLKYLEAPQYSIQYKMSNGQLSPKLYLKDIAERIFFLSFDPNHAPELRWGAMRLKNFDQGSSLSSEQLKWGNENWEFYNEEEYSSNDFSVKRHYANYGNEQLQRNRLTKTIEFIKVVPENNILELIAKDINEYRESQIVLK